MSDMYVECLVKAKDSMALKVLKYLLTGLLVVCVLTSFIFGMVLLLVAIVLGIGVYFLGLLTDLEYEYLYLDRELTVDKVMAKTNRKRAAIYSVDRIEVLAPEKSYHLDDYKNRTVKEYDYSSVEENAKHYVMYYEGGQKVLFTPSEEMVKAIKSVSPRKVFMD